MNESVIANLPEKTGKSLHQWLTLLQQAGPLSEKEKAAWLKSQHGLGAVTASLIAYIAEGNEVETSENYLKIATGWVDTLFAGSKLHLRSIYEELASLAKVLGSDVKICPCKTIIPFYRHHVFAQIKPSTQKRVDLGLALAKAQTTSPRLIETGGLEKKDRITHRIPLTSIHDIDQEVKDWLKIAYDLDA
jgi:hypothetical protein